MEVPGGSFRCLWNCWRCSRGFLGGPCDVLRGARGLVGGFLGLLELFFRSLGVSPGHPWRDPGGLCDVLGVSWGVLGGFLAELVGDLGPHMLCRPMIQCLTLFLVECVFGVSWNVRGGAQPENVMHIMCFTVFGSVFTWRDAAPGVSFGDSLGNLLGGLGPHMSCTFVNMLLEVLLETFILLHVLVFAWEVDTCFFGTCL